MKTTLKHKNRQIIVGVKRNGRTTQYTFDTFKDALTFIGAIRKEVA